LLSALFRLSCVVRELWNGELKEDNVARVQHGIFYSDHFNYFGVDRIGGTFSYLKSKYGDNAKPKDDERVSDCDETTDTEYNDDNDQSQNDDDSREFVLSRNVRGGGRNTTRIVFVPFFAPVTDVRFQIAPKREK